MPLKAELRHRLFTRFQAKFAISLVQSLEDVLSDMVHEVMAQRVNAGPAWEIGAAWPGNRGSPAAARSSARCEKVDASVPASSTRQANKR